MIQWAHGEKVKERDKFESVQKKKVRFCFVVLFFSLEDSNSLFVALHFRLC